MLADTQHICLLVLQGYVLQGRNVSLDAIGAVLRELGSVSPDVIFHLGGDEVEQSCWATDPTVLSWMKKNGMGNNTGTSNLAPAYRILHSLFFGLFLQIWCTSTL